MAPLSNITKNQGFPAPFPKLFWLVGLSYQGRRASTRSKQRRDWTGRGHRAILGLSNYSIDEKKGITARVGGWGLHYQGKRELLLARGC